MGAVLQCLIFKILKHFEKYFCKIQSSFLSCLRQILPKVCHDVDGLRSIDAENFRIICSM